MIRMEKFIFLILGIVFAIIGIINMTGNISSIHSYNRKKVKGEDIPKYGKTVGLGTLIIGLGLITKFVFDLFKLENIGWYVIVATLIIGIALMLFGQFKYNKGIF